MYWRSWGAAEGQDEYPVGGVSWYEAAAYCESAGKSLPTYYHWRRAANPFLNNSYVLDLSNFSGKGPGRRGEYHGLGAFGTFDMAGNVKEWVLNEIGNQRAILGGAWDEVPYFFKEDDSQPPFCRRASYGFRCARLDAPVRESLAARIEPSMRDFSKSQPASDEVFRIYRGLYAYDRADLRATTDTVDDSNPYWRREKVSFDAATGRSGCQP